MRRYFTKSRLAGALAVAGILLATPVAIAEKKIDGDSLLDPNRLLDIRITLPADDWKKLCEQSRDAQAYFRGQPPGKPFTYFKADISIDGRKIKSVGIRKKGLFGSQDNRRPSLKVKFDEFVEQQPIRGLSRLTLNNNKQDTSQVSQYLTYKLFRDAGIHAPRCSLARVSVNGTSLGIYSHVESIKKPFLKKSFGKTIGALYEGTLTDFHPKTVEKLEAKNKQARKERTALVQLAKMLDQKGEVSQNALEKIVDLDNFMKYWALEGMIRFWDGYSSNQNNYFIYLNPKNGLGYFIPWGADGSFTRGGGPFGFANRQGSTAVYAQSLLTNRLYRTKGIPDRYRATMRQLLDTVWKEKELVAEIDRMEKLVTPHLHDSQRGAPRAMNDVRGFINSRRNTLKTELANWPARVQEEPRKPMYTVAIGHVRGTFTTAFSQTRPAADPSTIGKTVFQVNLNQKPVEFQRIGISAQAFQPPRFGAGFGFGRRRPGAGVAAARPRINLVLTGVRAADGRRVTASIVVDQTAFVAGDKAIDINGTWTEGRSGRFGGFGRSNQSVSGKLWLSKSGTKNGDPVAGRLDLKIVEVHGGFFARQSPGRGFARPGFQNRGRPGVTPIPAIQRVLDADGDGKLSAREIQQAAQALKKLDRNNDGELSASELAAPAAGQTRPGPKR